MTFTHPPKTPLPSGYRLAELDDVADREAMREIDRWAFAFDLDPEDEPADVWNLEPGRSVGVWHDGPRGTTLAAMHSSYAFRVQVPGGEPLPAAGLTWVGVHPAHRRRGLSRAMLHAHLRRSRERGEVLSVLNAAESGIYGRYGYGIATHRVSATLGRGAGLRPVPGSEEPVVELESLDGPRHSAELERVHGQVVRPGWITRDTDALRQTRVLDWPSARRGAERRRIALVRDALGEPRGYALFRRKEKWSDEGKPEGTVQVHDVLALDAPAARALWAALLDLDLMAAVEVGNLAPDDAVLGLLTDVRGINRKVHDDVWLRILDLPAALRARAYPCVVDVVLEVSDPLVPDNAGRWHVRGGPQGVEVTRSQDPAHLAVDVSDLGAAYLGGSSLTALAAAGRVTELVPGTLVPAATAFSWPVAASTGWGF
ncbi:Predicted acetyltransferase [Georgenia satyanarayanai]|uniref:Predicted acetyltransferase n=1 Tax=Georgenia satyanarayanai TaxID=860221 RepID=A0A2Y9AQZ1_9MICO|nr:GNAT family N-acetyltransferase [Georgenia satyanarayanai]PYF96734.1 putative acetyltransferase [Georgenia satyanarayanai]SSA46476.1 Predicted acetyltransferase [Georgenia satyanarayanai]